VGCVISDANAPHLMLIPPHYHHHLTVREGGTIGISTQPAEPPRGRLIRMPCPPPHLIIQSKTQQPCRCSAFQVRQGSHRASPPTIATSNPLTHTRQPEAAVWQLLPAETARGFRQASLRLHSASQPCRSCAAAAHQLHSSWSGPPPIHVPVGFVLHRNCPVATRQLHLARCM
jgi:hypothetical protein